MGLRRRSLVTVPLFAVLAVTSCGSSPKASIPSVTTTSSTTTTTGATTTTLPDAQPVTVTGAPLPDEYSDPNGDTLDVAVGAQAPNLDGKSFDGTPVVIKNDGKAKVVIFGASWAPHVQRSFPVLAKWLKANAHTYNKVSIYAVSTASKALPGEPMPFRPAAAFFDAIDWPTAVLADDADNDAAVAYGLGAYPYFVVLDRQNKVITRISGETYPDELAKMLQQAQSA